MTYITSSQWLTYTWCEDIPAEPEVLRKLYYGLSFWVRKEGSKNELAPIYQKKDKRSESGAYVERILGGYTLYYGRFSVCLWAN